MSLSTTIKAIQDVMRKDVGVDGDAQRIGQLVWLLFLKIWDDREKEMELLEDGFKSPLLKVKWTDTAGERQRGTCAGGPGRAIPRARQGTSCSSS